MKDPRLIIRICLLAILVASASSCSVWRAVMPGGVSPSDAEWEGVKSGPAISLVATAAEIAGPEPDVLRLLLSFTGKDDPLGVILPVTLIGESNPRWILCKEAFVRKCNDIPLNAKVHFAGRPIGQLWLPSRLTADDFND